MVFPLLAPIRKVAIFEIDSKQFCLVSVVDPGLSYSILDASLLL